MTLAGWAGASRRDSHWVVQWQSAPTVPSGREGQGSQPGQGATELVLPGPALGQVQGDAARRAGEPSGEGEEASSQGFGCYQLLTETDARRPAGQVLGHHLDRQPGGVGGETSRWEVVEPDAVLEIPDGVVVTPCPRPSSATRPGQSAAVMGQKRHSLGLGTLLAGASDASRRTSCDSRSMNRSSMAEAGMSTTWSA